MTVARFAKDLRTDTLAIGVLHALAWYVVYPYSIMFLQIAGLFGEVLETPYLALLAIGAAPLALAFLGFAVASLSIPPVVAYSGAVIAKSVYGYRLPGDSWGAVFNLGVAYSVLCVLTFVVGIGLFPPEFARTIASTAPPYMEAQHNVHSWLWPGGLALVSVVLSFVSATVTFLVLRPMKGAP